MIFKFLDGKEFCIYWYFDLVIEFWDVYECKKMIL